MTKVPVGSAAANMLLVKPFRHFASTGNRIPRAITSKLRSLVLRFADPDIEVDYANDQIVMPLSHNLPFTRALHPTYGNNLQRVIDCIADSKDHTVVVDIGANIGDTAKLASRPDVDFICIEGHPDFYDYLLRNTADMTNVDCKLAMVGAPGHLLALNTENGTAAPKPSDDGVPTKTLTELVPDRSVDLIKIDTDGYDGVILETNLDFLAVHQPSLFFEYDPSQLPADLTPLREVVSKLVADGYEYLLVWDKYGDLLVAGRGDDMMHDLDRWVRRGKQRYFDIAMVRSSDLFESIRAGEHAFSDAH